MNKKVKQALTAAVLASCLIAAPVHADYDTEDGSEVLVTMVQVVAAVVFFRWLWNQVAR